MRRRAALAAAAIAVSVVAACAPKTDVQVGLKDYNTDVVYGAKRKAVTPPPPAPVPGATPNPGFPGFMVPPPAPVAAMVPVSAPAPVACPQAGFGIPPTAAVDIAGPPAAGVYEYRTTGTVKVDDQVSTLPATTSRTIEVVDADPAQPSWKVSIASGTTVATTTYQLRRLVPAGTLDGIYITQVVVTEGSAAPQEFTPSGLGLQVFTVPAQVGTTWDSVATDPLHSTTMRLAGTTAEKRRIDACGDLVEGWATRVGIDLVGATPGVKQLRIDAEYVTVPQLGGLIVADSIRMTGTDGGAVVEQTVESVISNIEPRPVG